ncbi:MAG: TIGR04282 family arsenosugar biosynthesis glycosyltransferase [Deltaproteobacteria bacterium]|nr:TIGR04282 family arsenosugar biosynthesis glycosyltransferase [Deltaproteobacteria bacterium]
MKIKKAIAIMVKAPLPKMVKTRLTPPLTEEAAAELYKCFIRDIFARIGRLTSIDIFAAYTPFGEERFIKQLIGEDISLVLQRGNSLGERLANLFSDLFIIGYKKVVVIGSDSPDVPLEYIKTAFIKLNKIRVVFGPTEDGGYYLAGMNRFNKEIFKNIPWSTNKVLEKSLEVCSKEGTKTFLLPKWYDVDTYNDLKRLVKDSDPEEIPNTYKFVITNKLCRSLSK